ncbi:hypothetical protein LMH87_012008 [Akanthomyces muscarius]|uniref:Oxidoreductase n=1 Tax=Akanthomyces muscarius TaxID=2231603 RepID=A0A9W8QB27_AKAMU|nr:hypothetical protein LMH87_012008 [Akanthomyces muscarius]KAJ4151299.1 hypothetical protein LMH87_012008 [Akanthomyces muscarius]
MASQFQHERDIPITKQSFPGKEYDMPNPQPTRDEVPGSSGHGETYRAAGKLRGKRAIITGGDSGIGASTALLFAREGAVSTIAYLPEEEKDAQDTRNQIQDNGGTCYLVALDLSKCNQCLAKDIRVNAVAPGPVWTPLIPSTMDDEAQENFTSPMGRPAQPSEIATCVVFLASPDSSCISGQTIHCNGGTVVNG